MDSQCQIYSRSEASQTAGVRGPLGASQSTELTTGPRGVPASQVGAAVLGDREEGTCRARSPGPAPCAGQSGAGWDQMSQLEASTLVVEEQERAKP